MAESQQRFFENQAISTSEISKIISSVHFIVCCRTSSLDQLFMEDSRRIGVLLGTYKTNKMLFVLGFLSWNS